MGRGGERARRKAWLAGAMVWAGCGAGSRDPADAGPDRPDAPDTPPREEQLCSEGWCWEAPLPQGNDLHAVWSFGPDDVWAAGADATVIHWDGAGWSYRGPRAPGETEESYSGLWGAAPDDLWLWGLDGLWRWDGDAWSRADPDPDRRVADLAGSGPTSLWAVGEDGLVAHWDGARWSVETIGAGDLTAVREAAPHVWAIEITAGENLEDESSVLWHFDGAAWSPDPRGDVFRGLGGGPDAVYRYGAAEVSRWEGAQWEPVELPFVPAVLRGSAPTDLWAIDGSAVRAAHYDGVEWTEVELPGAWPPRDVASAAPGEAWSVGARGRVSRWDGAAWTVVAGPPIEGEAAQPGGAPWGTAGEDLWAGGESGGVLHWDGSGWSAESVEGWYADVMGSGRDLWAAGSYGLLAHREGDEWSTTDGGGPPHFNAVWVSSSTDAWAVGDAIAHHDGSDWTIDPDLPGEGISLRAVWGSGGGEVWAVGDEGVILHWDGGGWENRSDGATEAWQAVWGSESDDVWVAGTAYAHGTFHGTLRRWDGARWSAQPSPTPDGEIPDALWGSGPDDLWLASRYTGSRGGTYGRLYRWNGADWIAQGLPTRQSLAGLWGWGRERLAVVTREGGLLRHRSLE